MPPLSYPDAGHPAIALAETCRVVGEGVTLWPLHGQRLSEGGCGKSLLGDVACSLFEAIAAYRGERTSRLRAHVEVRPDGRVSIEIERRLSSLDVVHGPLIAPVRSADLGPRLAVPPGGAKPVDRSWWDAAARQARLQGAHQAAIIDDDGFLVDGSSASVWIVVGRTIVTPPAPPAVAGVARRFVLGRARDYGHTTSIAPVSWSDIERADEVFLTNALGGAVAVRDRGGPMTERVQAMFARVWPRRQNSQT